MRAAGLGIVPTLPTLLTLGNIVCGFVAMAKTVDALHASTGSGPLDPAFSEKLVHACWFVLAGTLFDALDGRMARITGQASAFGAQLDSLADVVTFGVAPALIAKVVYEHGMTGMGLHFFPKFVTLLCALYLIGAVLRLARFTVSTDTDETSHHTFAGLPSPAAAGFVVSACLFIFEGRRELWLPDDVADALGHALVRALPGVACGLGLLMISRVPYVHVVQRYVGSRARVPTVVNLVLLGWLLVFFHAWMLFGVALVYVLGGLALALRARITGRRVLDVLPDPWDDDRDDRQPGPGAGSEGDGSVPPLADRLGDRGKLS